ncbi:LCP family protein [Paenibacillus caui]|uniref:LCP family protein n=1 Tax=Paenibacillus caui TaxID=2873927 RepID=UPI001CA8B296|nr:LCP family protein [Paenibacillus caui]
MNRTKRKTWRFMLIPGGILLLLAGLCSFIFWRLQPEQHFRHADIPVLSVPEPESESVKGSPQTAPTQQIPSSGLGSGPALAADANASGTTAATGSGVRFNVLVLGIDARADEDSRTDVMMLAHVNLDRKTVDLISIPRDTRVQIKGVGYTKINHAHLVGELQGGSRSGTSASLQAVSNLCRCSINYYVKTNFDGFVHFIDSIGGLDLDLSSPVRLTYAHRTLPAGKQHLDGDLTLKLVQERRSLSSGDINRQQNQALVMRAVIRKMLEPDNLVRIPSLVTKVKEDIVDTNLSDRDIVSLSLLAKGLKSEDIGYVQIPGHSGRAKDPLVGKELYYWIPNLEAWWKIAKNVLED